MSFEYVPKSDGAPSDATAPATYSANKVVGDVYPQGADEPFQRILNTRGGGMLTTNSDPAVVGVDPLTGANAPTGTDVGFAAPVRRFIQAGVLNGDFSQGPPDPNRPISADNPLPYWTYEEGGFGQGLLWSPDSTYASGYKILPASQVGGTGDAISQMIPLPMSQGQQYRVLLSAYGGTGATLNALIYQFYRADGTTTVGSLLSASFGLSASELKIDAGLVPPTAAYIKLMVRFGTGVGAAVVSLAEVRCAFPPAELPVTLKTLSASVGAITTAETQVIGCTIPADTFVVGATYTVKAWFTMTSTVANVATFRLRCGATTLTGTVLTSMNPTATTTASGDGFYIEATFTIRSIGAGGTAWASMEMVAKTTQPFAVGHRVEVGTATVAVNTTQANVLELTAETAAGTTSTTARMGLIRCEYAA